MTAAGSATAPRKAGTLQALALIVPVALSVMGAVLLAPIVPKLMAQFHDVPNARYWVPTLLSVPALCIALFSPFAGAVADRVGRRKLLMIAMAAYAGFGLAPLLLDSFVAIYLTRVGVGICEGIVLTCTTTMIGDFFEGPERDKWLGSQAAIASITALAMFPIAGVLGEAFGWRGPFLMYGTSLILLIGVALLTWEPSRREAQHSEDPAAKAGAIAFPWAHMIEVCAVTLIAAVMFYILQFQMSTALVQLGQSSIATIGMLTAVASIGVPLGAITFGAIKKYLSVHTLLAMEFGIMAAGFYGMSQAQSSEAFIVAGFLNQFGAGMILPTLLTWAMQRLPYVIRGRGTGMWQASFAAGQFLSTLSFAAVSGMTDGIMPAFRVFAIICAIAFIVALLATMQKRRSIAAQLT